MHISSPSPVPMYDTLCRQQHASCVVLRKATILC